MIKDRVNSTGGQITVLTYGTFDLFHIGHLKLLERLSSLGDKLIVGVSTDEFNEVKQKKTIVPFVHRSEIVRAIDYVDLVIPESSWDQKKKDIEVYDVDIFAMGNDWSRKFDDLENLCKVIYLPRTKNVSTTDIKKALQDIYKLRIDDMSLQFELLAQLLEDLK